MAMNASPLYSRTVPIKLCFVNGRAMSSRQFCTTFTLNTTVKKLKQKYVFDAVHFARLNTFAPKPCGSFGFATGFTVQRQHCAAMPQRRVFSCICPVRTAPTARKRV